MNDRYDDLKELVAKDVFVGDRYTAQLSDFIHTQEGLVIIQGLPPCPECGHTLSHIYLQGMWHCPDCDTQWDEHSLVEALQNERAVAKLYKEETDK